MSILEEGHPPGVECVDRTATARCMQCPTPKGGLALELVKGLGRVVVVAEYRVES